jgi:hypothetical protein
MAHPKGGLTGSPRVKGEKVPSAKGGLTGSQRVKQGSEYFDKPQEPQTPEQLEEVIQATDAKARERLKSRFENNNGTATSATTQSQSGLTRGNHTQALQLANQIGSQYGVAEIDVKDLLGTDPYKADGNIPEMKAADANREKLKIQRQNNALEVRHEKIKQGRKIAQLAKEQILLVGDFVDYHTARIDVATKVVKNQQSEVKYNIEVSKLDQLDELLIQQDIATQGTKNLTPGIRDEWVLKVQNQATKNDRIRLDIEGATVENERKREEIEARLID